MNEALLAILSDADALVADGFEESLIGYTQSQPVRAVYDYDACVSTLCEYMNYDEAVEFMDFNVVSADLGDGTPIFISIIEDDSTH